MDKFENIIGRLPNIPKKVEDANELLTVLKNFNDVLYQLFNIRNICLFDTGTYTGDGAVSLSVTQHLFQPKYAKIFTHPSAEADMEIWEKLDQTWTTYGIVHGVTATHEHKSLTSGLISLVFGGFTVGDIAADSHPNKTDQVYDYYILG